RAGVDPRDGPGVGAPHRVFRPGRSRFPDDRLVLRRRRSRAARLGDRARRLCGGRTGAAVGAGGGGACRRFRHRSVRILVRISGMATIAIMTDLPGLARHALELAAEKRVSIVTAESCTAGKLCALLSEAPGAAVHLQGGFVTYT